MVQPQYAGYILIELFAFIKIFRVPCGKFDDRDIAGFAPPADHHVFPAFPGIVPDAVVYGIDGLEITADRLHDEQEGGKLFLCM